MMERVDIAGWRFQIPDRDRMDEALLGQVIERRERLRQTGIRDHDGAFGGIVDGLPPLPIEQVAEPEIEGEQRHASEENPDGNRDQILARQRAHSLSHSASKAGFPRVRRL